MVRVKQVVLESPSLTIRTLRNPESDLRCDVDISHWRCRRGYERTWFWVIHHYVRDRDNRAYLLDTLISSADYFASSEEASINADEALKKVRCTIGEIVFVD